MNRRRFLKTSMAAGLGVLCTPGSALAGVRRPSADTVLVTLNFEGGPDFRHVFVPPYDPENAYSMAFWEARALSHNLSPTDPDALASRAGEYLLPAAPEYQYFGISPSCGWLKTMFDQGHVAIVNNVYCSTNRDHSHSTLILESANSEAGPTDTEQSGWGGRLAHHAQRNIVSVTRSVRLFCYGPHATDPLDHDNARVISAMNSRNMGLYEFSDYSGAWPWSREGNMSRALSSYYAAKAGTMGDGSPYRQFIQHEKSQREFGRVMRNSLYGRLMGTSSQNLELPPEIVALYTENSVNPLHRHTFGTQLRNIYDVMHSQDVLDLNVISAEYPGWDHHRELLERIEPALSDVFGTGKGLDTLFTQLGPLADKLVFLVYGEFGRQLVANGDNGIDHGVGNSMLVIGKQVQGGVYGELFPEDEVLSGRYLQSGADITGQTSFKQVIGRVCEKVSPGTAESVVPGWSGTDLEPGVDLSGLFT